MLVWATVGGVPLMVICDWLPLLLSRTFFYEVRRSIYCTCPCPFPFCFRKPEAVECSLFPHCQSDSSSEKLETQGAGKWFSLGKTLRGIYVFEELWRIRWSLSYGREQLLFVLGLLCFWTARPKHFEFICKWLGAFVVTLHKFEKNTSEFSGLAW